jgi:SWI/SNF-related matrix-associated actin-dependent regulator 1 of chromatin subfamily A
MYDFEPLRCAIDALLSEDGNGFNKIDAFFGKCLSGKPTDDWSVRQTRSIWELLAKYRTQLISHGMYYTDIPEPPLSNDPKEDRRMVLDTDGGVIMVAFEYNPTLVDGIKSLPTNCRKYDKASRVWTIKPHLDLIDLIVDYATNYDFDVEERVFELLSDIVDKHKDILESSRATSSDFEIEGLGAELYPFQRAGVAYAVATQRCFIADQMGLGKTVQALAAVWHEKAFPAAVVCPASVKYNWAIEAIKWLPGIKIGIVMGRNLYGAHRISEKKIYLDKDRHNLPGSFDLIIFNYDVIKPKPKKWVCFEAYTNQKNEVFEIGDAIFEPLKGFNRDTLELVREHFKRDGYGESKNGLIEKLLKIKLKSLTLDESHLAKTFNSQRTQGLVQLSKKIPMRLLLSGTPVLNRPSELISQLNILGRLNDLGGFKHFTEHYCGAYDGRFGLDLSGFQNLEELNKKMRSTFYLRRTKAQVLTELPAKQRSDIMFELDNKSEYNEARDDLIAWLKQNAKLEQEFLDSISDHSIEDQRSLTADYRHSKAIRAERALQLSRIEHLKQLAAKGKMKSAVKWINNFLESGEKLIVFASHIDIQKMLVEEFKGCAHVMGADSAEVRQNNIGKFQEDPLCQIIICSLKAAGVGITLTAASDVAFLEFGWTPADHDQAEDRSHRIGQKDNVMAWYLLAEDSIDIDIQELISEKRAVVDAATEGESSSVEDLNIMNDLIKRLMK